MAVHVRWIALGVLAVLAGLLILAVGLVREWSGASIALTIIVVWIISATVGAPVVQRVPSKVEEIFDVPGPVAPLLRPQQARLDLLLDRYRTQLQQFNGALRLLCVISFVSLVAVTAAQDDSSVNLLGISVPLQTVRIVLPAFSLIVWLSFGYSLNSTIDSRLATVLHIHRNIGERYQAENPYVLDTTIRSIVNDAGFLDLWFRSFYPKWIAGVPTSAWPGLQAHITGTVVYGIILGLHHGTMLAMPLRATGESKLWLAYAMPLFVLLLFSHIQFAYAGRNRNYFQPVVAIVSILVLVAIFFLVPRANAP
jgi:hypothetical protein